MISRDDLRVDVVFPLTTICGEANCQVDPEPAGNEAYVRFPVYLEESMPPMVISALPTFFGVK